MLMRGIQPEEDNYKCDVYTNELYTVYVRSLPIQSSINKGSTFFQEGLPSSEPYCSSTSERAFLMSTIPCAGTAMFVRPPRPYVPVWLI